MTGRTLLVHLELDGNLAAECRDTEWNLELALDVLPALRATAARSRASASAKHGAEDVTEAPKAPDIEILEVEFAGAGRPRASSRPSPRPRATTTKPAEGP